MIINCLENVQNNILFFVLNSQVLQSEKIDHCENGKNMQINSRL